MPDKKPWLKFYPSDWRADQTLRICGAAARGLWIEMLCLMHEAKPYGHLIVSGRPVTEAQLATLSGFPQDQVFASLAELENAGVFSRTAKGVIYSRRMTRDEAKAVKCSQAGEKGGGNPALKRTFDPTFKGQGEVTFDPEARGHKPDKQDSFQDLVRDVCKPRNQKERSKQEIKAIWQSNILREAERTMPTEQFTAFTAAWADDDPKAIRLAEQIDRSIKARKRQPPNLMAG